MGCCAQERCNILCIEGLDHSQDPRGGGGGWLPPKTNLQTAPGRTEHQFEVHHAGVPALSHVLSLLNWLFSCHLILSSII